MNPLISIVIPVYNRANFIGRAIKSCLSQTYGNFEIIVVDDGSTDNSCGIVTGFNDPRIQLVRQNKNLGVGPARNLGADRAKSDWVLMLDSDDELVHSALEIIASKIDSHGAAVGAFLFRCKMDDGSLSPSVIPKYGVINYCEYLEHINACSGKKRDNLSCRKKTTFAKVKYPDNRGLEDLYWLDLSKAFPMMLCEDVLRLYHQDADDQLVKRVRRFDRGSDAQFAKDRADVLTQAIHVHGKALRGHAPLLLQEFMSRTLMLRLCNGERLKALDILALTFMWKISKPSYVMAYALGFLHPSVLLWARSLRAGN